MILLQKKPVLFLDLDGTVRITKSGKDFPDNPEDQKLSYHIEEVIGMYKRNGYSVVGISNQAGVAYGFKSLDGVYKEIGITRSLFAKDPFSFILFAPCHPKGTKEPYNQKTFLRKPDTGMLAVAEYKFMSQGMLVDWDKSVFVGDRDEDLKCAENAGLKFLHVSQFINDGYKQFEQR